MKTKEEILDKCIEDNGLIDEFASGYAYDPVLTAMQEYADQFKNMDLVKIEDCHIEDVYHDGVAIYGRVKEVWITKEELVKLKSGRA